MVVVLTSREKWNHMMQPIISQHDTNAEASITSFKVLHYTQQKEKKSKKMVMSW